MQRGEREIGEKTLAGTLLRRPAGLDHRTDGDGTGGGGGLEQGKSPARKKSVRKRRRCGNGMMWSAANTLNLPQKAPGPSQLIFLDGIRKIIGREPGNHILTVRRERGNQVRMIEGIGIPCGESLCMRKFRKSHGITAAGR